MFSTRLIKKSSSGPKLLQLFRRLATKINVNSSIFVREGLRFLEYRVKIACNKLEIWKLETGRSIRHILLFMYCLFYTVLPGICRRGNIPLKRERN
jgi:hypothetical protein